MQVGFQRSRPPDTSHLTNEMTLRLVRWRPARSCCQASVAAQISLRCCSRPPCRREPHGHSRCRGRAPMPVDSGEGGGRSCGRICAGGTPAFPGGHPPMTGSHQRDQNCPKSFWRQFSLQQVHPVLDVSSCILRVHSMVPSSLTIGRFSMDLIQSRQGGRPARRQTGVSQRGQAGFQRSRPPDTPHLTIGTTPPGSAGVPPACCPFGCRSVSLRCCSRPPCRREPHGPGRSRGRAPLPVDSGEGGGRSCGRICAGGTPALPGGLPPMTGSHQRDKSAEAFWRQLSLKEVHQSSCLT